MDKNKYIEREIVFNKASDIYVAYILGYFHGKGYKFEDLDLKDFTFFNEDYSRIEFKLESSKYKFSKSTFKYSLKHIKTKQEKDHKGELVWLINEHDFRVDNKNRLKALVKFLDKIVLTEKEDAESK